MGGQAFLEALYATKRGKISAEGIANRWETSIFRHNPNPFCAKFLAQRHAKAAKLLSHWVTVGSLDPQVALLLRQCAGYCKLVHLARSTPPSLISDGLAFV